MRIISSGEIKFDNTKHIWYNEVLRMEPIMPISGKELAKLFKKNGFEEVKGSGKGSHMKFRKGNKIVIIPAHKELKKGLERALRKQLKEYK